MIKILRSVAAGAVLSFGAATSLFSAECIAPANPGGGWDFTCRTITKIMYDIGAVDSPIQVTNMAGGGGGLAYGHVVNERNTDDDLVVAASSATATRLAQNAYSGMTYDQVRFLGAIGADPGVIVVAADSPHKNLNDLLDAVIAAVKPPTVWVIASASPSTPMYLTFEMSVKPFFLKAIRTFRWSKPPAAEPPAKA